MSADTRVKICGVRTVEAAVVAAEAGADFLGFVFVEGVRRQLQPNDAAAIIGEFRSAFRSDGPEIVGLFRDQPAEWVNGVVALASLDYVQLNGAEDLAYATDLVRPVVRQVRIRPETTHDELSELVQSHLDAGWTVLLDAYDAKEPGGAGKTFDWSVAEGVADRRGVLLAGGLNPENVAKAVQQLHPWGVDVSSGVETDGQKDHGKVRAFIEAARSA